MILLFDAAAESGLFEALPGSASALATDHGFDVAAVEVVLDGLSLWNIVEADSDGVYSLGSAAPTADAAAVLRHHAGAIRRWITIAKRVRGVSPDPRPTTPGRMEIMLDAMAVRGRESAPGAVDACLELAPHASSVLDLGGGHGQFAVEFARRGLRAVLQDRPEVIDLARRKGWLTGSDVELFAGDFFESVPDEHFDLVFCAGVAYTLDGERLVQLFEQVRRLLRPGGHLAVHTFLRDTDELATLFSGEMLGSVGRGRQHSEGDLRRWLDEAGYLFVATQRLARRPEWMITASLRGSTRPSK